MAYSHKYIIHQQGGFIESTKLTSFARYNTDSATLRGGAHKTNQTNLTTAAIKNTPAGRMVKIVSSKNRVKSKRPRQASTAGPKALS